MQKASYDFFAVMESVSPADKHEIIQSNVVNGNVTSLRFRACLQDFGQRNRNGRLWTGRYMQPLLNADHIHELMNEGGWPGENGHPVPDSGTASLERISTIDPNNISHLVRKLEWEGDRKVYGIVDTIDDVSGPGARFARNIMQGMTPSFSVRALVPQRKNQDGSIDVMPGGRVISYDRVILPSHKAAYRDKSVDIRAVTTTANYATTLESLLAYGLEKSDKLKYVLDNTDPIMESASFANGLFSVNTEKAGRIFVRPEKNVKDMIQGFMKDLI